MKHSSVGKKCLILGGTGFLGHNLCRALCMVGYDVRIYGRNEKKLCDMAHSFDGLEAVCGDFVHERNFAAILEDVGIVFHLISTTKPANKKLPKEFTENVLPTLNFLESCLEQNIRVIYFSSGGTIYGEPVYLPLDEKHPTAPLCAYGIHNLTVEKCLVYYGRMYGLDYLILRLANPYGSYQDYTHGQGAIAVFLAKTLLHQPIEIWGTGDAVRDYVYVDDVMEACLALLPYTGKYRVFNLGSGCGYSLREILRIMKETLGLAPTVLYQGSRRQDVVANVLDSSLLAQEIGWRAHTSLQEGMQKMLKMWDANLHGYIRGDK